MRLHIVWRMIGYYFASPLFILIFAWLWPPDVVCSDSVYSCVCLCADVRTFTWLSFMRAGVDASLSLSIQSHCRDDLKRQYFRGKRPMSLLKQKCCAFPGETVHFPARRCICRRERAFPGETVHFPANDFNL